MKQERRGEERGRYQSSDVLPVRQAPALSLGHNRTEGGRGWGGWCREKGGGIDSISYHGAGQAIWSIARVSV